MFVTCPRRVRISATALSVPAFRWYWLSQMVSLTGTWMQTTAQAWLVLILTNSPLALALLGVAQFAPILIFGLFGGVVSDHLPTRQLLVVTQAGAGLLSLVVAVLALTHQVEMWHVGLAGFLLGLLTVVDVPARQLMVFQVVGRESLLSAIGLNAIGYNVARIAGPALAGVLIAGTASRDSQVSGIGVAFLVNAFSYVPVLAFLVRTSAASPSHSGQAPRSLRAVAASVAEGLRFAMGSRRAALVLALVSLVAAFGLNFNVLIPPIAEGTLHAGAFGFGLLSAFVGVGSLIGAAVVMASRVPRDGVMVLGALMLGGALAIFGLSRSFPVSLAAMAVVGVGVILMSATASSMLQLAAPAHMRGRVAAIYNTLYVGATPIGGVLLGATATAFSTPVAVVLGGVVSAVVALLFGAALRSEPSIGVSAPHPDHL